MTIRINSENLNKKRKIDLSKLEDVARLVLNRHKRPDAELNMIFVSSQKIRAMNRKWFGKDRATDVIAWPSGDNGVFLGDIAISSDAAARNSGEYGLSFEEEISLYVIHGILHLLGYDDRTARKRAKMRKEEDALLQKARKAFRK
ncbi:MAG: rRNA maturation RNase YbeY [Candidatus Omnitrophica bacterium]|nr:rRNA maturation RNase YbeY [Candidatus Omnitrophota bacterium]